MEMGQIMWVRGGKAKEDKIQEQNGKIVRFQGCERSQYWISKCFVRYDNKPCIVSVILLGIFVACHWKVA